jgi:hypothetical protein
LQIALGREGHRVDGNLQPTPLCADQIEYGFQFSGNGNVHRAGDRRFKFLGERLNVGPCLFIEPGDREVCASSADAAAGSTKTLDAFGDLLGGAKTRSGKRCRIVAFPFVKRIVDFVAPRLILRH